MELTIKKQTLYDGNTKSEHLAQQIYDLLIENEVTFNELEEIQNLVKREFQNSPVKRISL